MDPRHHRASGGLLCSSQGCFDDCSGVGHEGPCKRAQTEQSRTEAKTQADYLSLIAFKPPSDFGADTVVGRIPGRLTRESLDRLSMTLQNQKQPTGR